NDFALTEPPLARPVQLRSLTLSAAPVVAPAAAAAPAAALPNAERPAPRQPPTPSQATENGISILNQVQALVDTAPEATVSVVAQATPSSAAEPAPAPPEPAAVQVAPGPDSAPAAVAGSARIKYDVTGLAKDLNYQASAEMLWLHDGSRYEAKLTISALFIGSRSETSEGELTPAGLRPLRYLNKRRGAQAAHFDYALGRVRFSANTPDAPLQPGAQDRISVALQLGALLAGDPLRYPAGSRITLQTVGPRDTDIWVFEISPAAQLSLPGGEQSAVKLARLPRREFDQTVEIWLAPAQNYLPVRIKLTQSNGDFADLQWRSTAAP
ncbi:MAG: DUF3108 domain-containing protein, partial [Burkholderiaceae bacterium]